MGKHEGVVVWAEARAGAGAGRGRHQATADGICGSDAYQSGAIKVAFEFS
jgi:hypothetical protein